jgi:cytochrome c oxidase assembly factor CtaG
MTAVTRWSFDPVAAVVLAVAAIAYARAARHVGAQQARHAIPRARQVWFFAGLLTIAVAVFSPVHSYGEERFVVHMAQHVLLALIAAPLLVLGAPVTLALRAANTSRRRELLRILNGRVVGLVTHPLVAWVQFAVVMWATHFSSFFQFALEHPWAHALEHGLFLGSAALFWWPVVGESTARPRLSYPLRLLYVALAMPQNTFLALAIVSSDRVLYASYGSLADQRRAGGLMWIAGDLALLAIVLVLAASWARHEERAARRRERLEDERDRAAHAPAQLRIN